MVSIERAAGWSRQLRLTPLSPGGLHRDQDAGRDGARAGLGGAPCSSSAGSPASRIDARCLWVATGLSVWVGSLVFAAFGLFLGYLLPTENVMQFLGLIVALLELRRRPVRPDQPVPAGPPGPSPSARPLYGLNQLVHAPLLNQGVDLDLGGQCRDLAGHFRRRRDLAIPDGHRAGVGAGRPPGRRPLIGRPTGISRVRCHEPVSLSVTGRRGFSNLLRVAASFAGGSRAGNR